MPRRYGLKYRSRRNWSRRRWTRRTAATSISRAWRARKRRKVSLSTRTMLSNRKQIKKIKKMIEPKWATNVAANAAGGFTAGQWHSTAIIPDRFGNLPAQDGVSLATNLTVLSGQGSDNGQFVGRSVVMKDLAVKILYQSDGAAVRTHLVCYLVLDHCPGQAAALQGASPELSLYDRANGSAYIPNGIKGCYLNKQTVGKGKRFQILQVKHLVVGPAKYTGDTGQVPAIETDTTGAMPDVTRAAYNSLSYISNLAPAPFSTWTTMYVKAPYKFEFKDGAAIGDPSLPVNKCIRLMAYQYKERNDAAGTNQTVSTMRFRAKFSYYDA